MPQRPWPYEILVPVAVSAALLASLPQAAVAAARLCGSPVLSTVSEAADAKAARRAAFDDWRRKAARQGKAYTSWRLAMERRARCAPLKDGRHTCVVYAVPCRIVQRVPDGVKPRPRLPLPKLKPKRPDSAAPRQI